MSDKTIQERLREFDDGPGGRGWKLCSEASDLIDRLRAELAAKDALMVEAKEVMATVSLKGHSKCCFSEKCADLAAIVACDCGHDEREEIIGAFLAKLEEHE